MNASLSLVRLDTSQLEELRTALTADGLPSEDVAAEDCLFFRAERGGQQLGYAGLQGNGEHRLLRSMWLRPDRRGQGDGSALLAIIERKAESIGVANLHLLTTTAASFFKRHGYVVADRAGAPACIAACREFTALCPASARYLVKSLGNRS